VKEVTGTDRDIFTPMADKRECREFEAGDGVVTLLPDEWVILNFKCRDCGRQTSTAILGPSSTYALDCDEKRHCSDCQKKSLIGILKDAGCKVPEPELLKMSLDQLLSLPGSSGA
jgi:hypothetical protein